MTKTKGMSGNRSMRTDEEYEQLVQALTVRRAPQHECDYCGKKCFVEQGELREEAIYGDNHIITVSWTTDPFDEEIRNDYTMHWLCTHCEWNQAMEI